MTCSEQFAMHADREEAAIEHELANGDITQTEANERHRDLQREAGDAYEFDLEAAIEKVRDEWR